VLKLEGGGSRKSTAVGDSGGGGGSSIAVGCIRKRCRCRYGRVGMATDHLRNCSYAPAVVAVRIHHSDTFPAASRRRRRGSRNTSLLPLAIRVIGRRTKLRCVTWCARAPFYPTLLPLCSLVGRPPSSGSSAVRLWAESNLK
jgi:hypothetical protein